MSDICTPPCTFPPDLSLGGLVSVVHRMHAIYLNARGISPGQIPFLLTVSKMPGVTQDDLVASFRIDKGTVARAVRRMEKNGLISRTPDTGDRRKVRLFLTAGGEALVPRIFAVDRAWEDALFAGFSDAERANVHAALRMLAERSHEIARGGEDDARA